MGLVAARMVQLKMLPFDNKSEFQVIPDLPEGATLETSNAAAQEVAAWPRRAKRGQIPKSRAGARLAIRSP